MKNIEKYENEISLIAKEIKTLSCAIATVAGLRNNGRCEYYSCRECQEKCLKWMYSEYKEQILSDEEKDIIRSIIDIIHEFGCKAVYFSKHGDRCGNAYVEVNYENNLTGYSYEITTPWFKNDKFKGMEFDKEYTLEELGITCPTQKDN